MLSGIEMDSGTMMPSSFTVPKYHNPLAASCSSSAMSPFGMVTKAVTRKVVLPLRDTVKGVVPREPSGLKTRAPSK